MYVGACTLGYLSAMAFENIENVEMGKRKYIWKSAQTSVRND